MPINIYGMPSGYDQPSGPRGRKPGGIRNPNEQVEILGPGGTTTPTAWGETPQRQQAPPYEAPTQDTVPAGLPPRRPAPPSAPPVPPTPPAPPAGRTSVNPGLDPGKWSSGHQSPKYAFYEVAQKYDQKTPEGRAATLAELQQRFPQWYTGWTVAGDKLRFAGDPNSLDGKWDGFTEFDAWRGSKAGEWTPQWMATGRNGQAWTDPAVAAQQAAHQTATQTYAPGQVPTAPPITPSAYVPPTNPMPSIPRPSTQALPPQRGSAEVAEDAMRKRFQFGIGQDDDLRTYEPINAIPEYRAPDFGRQEQAQIDALMGVLQNPGIPPAQMEQMKRRQMEELMATRDATMDQTQDNFLRRGLRGGALGAAERRAQENFGSDLTRSNRDIDIANAGMRTQDVLNASSGLSSAMGGAFDRANSGFSTALNRVLAGEGLRGASADSYRAVYNDDAGIGFNHLNLGEQIRQYDLSSQLAMKNFMEGQRQFNSGMGFNYSQLSQRQNEAMLRALGLM